MNFILEPSLFPDEGAFAPELVHLVLIAASGRHRIEVSEEARAGFARWAQRQGALEEEILGAEELSRKDMVHRPSAIEYHVERREDASWPSRRLRVEDAVEVASKPFRIFLENGASDRRFLLALFRREDRAWIEERADREWLELEGCGGLGELHKRVKWALTSNSRKLRCAAIFDGDAVELPAEDPEGEAAFRSRLGPTSRAVLETCQREPVEEESGFLHHVLRRRTIENYLPKSVLKKRWARGKTDRDRKVAAWVKYDYRHVYNMKGGHAKDRGRNPSPSWLPAKGEGGVLEGGFGEEISKLFEGLSMDALDEATRRELQPFVDNLLSRIR